MQRLMNLMSHMDVKAETPTLWVDNLPAIHIAENSVHHSRTKHILIKIHHIRKAISDGQIKISHKGTKEQLAGIAMLTQIGKRVYPNRIWIVNDCHLYKDHLYNFYSLFYYIE